jgi:O-antigen/teichoic acid export membrane protein
MGLNQNIVIFVNKCWHSPTLNTWLSYSTKALSLFLVLPLLLNRFSAPQIALWYLFSTVIALESLADLGFRITFIRMIAYGYGGAMDISNYTTEKTETHGSPNWDLIAKIFSTMKHIYKRVTWWFLFLLITIGSWSLMKPISKVSDPHNAWLAWGVIIIVASIKFYGTIYANYLEGLNKIAIVRRWETITSIGSILTSITVLYFMKSILWLVVANQAWVLVNMGRDIVLCRKLEKGKYKQLNTSQKFDKVMFKKIWTPAWRSGLAAFMSSGLSNITSIIYAQIGSSPNVAAYLLALRVINQIRDVSAAPFYSKIPLFAQLIAQNKMAELVKKAQRSMFLSNMIFIIGSITFGILAKYILTAIHSKITFIDQWLWVVLTVAYFIHRYGAMHVNLYNISNHIIAHIADGVSGIIFIVVTFALIHKYDLYAIPIGLICGYLGFYSWYAGMHSYKFMDTKFLKFEFKASGLPICIVLAYILFNIIIKLKYIT